MSHKKFGPDRFSRFDVYWIQTDRQAKFIYRLNYHYFVIVSVVIIIIIFQRVWVKIVINIRGPEIGPEIVKDLGPVTDVGPGQETRRSLLSEGSLLCTGMFPLQGLSTLLRFSTRACSRPVRFRLLSCRILPRFSLHHIIASFIFIIFFHRSYVIFGN